MVQEPTHTPRLPDAMLGWTPNYRVMMIVSTGFFADYGCHCHLRILEAASVLQRLGHQVAIAVDADANGTPVPGLGIYCTLLTS